MRHSRPHCKICQPRGGFSFWSCDHGSKRGISKPSAIICDKESLRPKTPLTLRDVICQNATYFPDPPAIISTNHVPLSYRDLRNLLDKFLLQMRQAGLDQTARIGVLLPQGPEAVLGIVAASCCAIAVPLDPRLTASELDWHFKRLRLSAILLPEGPCTVVHRAAERQGVRTVEVASLDNKTLTLN